ncbi:MAG: UDP-N-acetylmuramoyl-L-alanyl-D-glutamate--2,6-diaminopimelate ligase [Sterolibacteriaceae bacterium]|nr:UDP-N-acetylmuramoyl-L-alanyl-D-glutamate--2,6-diaminopimelate ligase [Candidatus Methylophosphatis haderslevensis]
MSAGPLQRAGDLLSRLRGLGAAASALCADSRALRAGDVFVAYPGHRSDGRRFIPDALCAGAGAVLWEQAGFAWHADWVAPNIPVDGLQPLSGHLAHLVYGRPSEHLDLVGVTGTNGKTSVSQWIAQALQQHGRKCGVIGTLGNGFPGALVDSPNTTPDGIALHAQLARFVATGAKATAMEVSSIGLAEGRTHGARFAVAVLTNLTRDHLDCHGTMQAYAAAKARLFDLPDLPAAVVNLDDAFGHGLAQRLPGRVGRVYGYTLNAEMPAPRGVEVLRARAIGESGAGIRFDLEAAGATFAVRASVVGRFNVSNLLAAIGALIALGVEPGQAAALVAHLVPPPGRMQPLGGNDLPLVIVDYAHTPDALEQVILALRPAAAARSGRIVCVFGCGGDRDPGKRAQMGEVASRLADAVVVTSDNPRSEDPQAIVDAVMAGAGANATAIIDRANAIRLAIEGADARDVVVIAGKGHEPYQEIRGVRHPFSDVAHATAVLYSRRAAAGRRT